ncbi:hypothetical protein [Actinokineospora iranica]|uniref:Uncharacterized protein n=1 Tax=Actinokineospora iranica TaxID=1271860 RepID=A0A1G6QLF1_9PSEU|nr:hypothetical protein [Actinokineospora iranica]SDC93189.1 hypothetical protein SAMN05216174_105366 [Actinokineospora iranica]
MANHEQYVRYREDSHVLAAIGTHIDAQLGRLTVRLPRAVAEAAVAAWERDEPAGHDTETGEQRALRDQAAELALIGLAIAQRGRWEDAEVVVDLDVGSAGAASRATR